MDSDGTGFYDEVKITLRHVLGGRNPLELWDQRRNECGLLRGEANIPHDKTWIAYWEDDAYHGDRTADAKEYNLLHGGKED